MPVKRKPVMLFCLLVAFCLFGSVSVSMAAEYEALKHIKVVQAVFDFRTGDPKAAALQMNLIHDTYRDLSLMKKKPVFMVIFMGPSIKLLSRDRTSFSPEDRKHLDEIARTIPSMSRNGIRFEICLVSASAFNTDPESILPEITKVENGWISSIGYQVQGYSLVPVF
jgi:intracellular sulfur oxidation DsrE/DsrF family protein